MSETDPRGYYTCLGLRPWATAADIRAAYHRCAKQWHPDVDPRPEAKARFQAITEAYRILINPAERAIYDRAAGADRSQSGATSLQPVFVTRPDLSIRWLSLGNRRAATLLLFGVLGLAAVLLSEMFPGAEERLASSLPLQRPLLQVLRTHYQKRWRWRPFRCTRTTRQARHGLRI